MRPFFVFVWLRREIKSSERSFGFSVRPLIIIIFLWPYLGIQLGNLVGSIGRRLHRVFPKQETCNSVDLCEQANISPLANKSLLLSSQTKLPFVLSINSKLPNCWLLCSSTFRSESPFEFRIQSVTFIQSRVTKKMFSVEIRFLSRNSQNEDQKATLLQLNFDSFFKISQPT